MSEFLEAVTRAAGEFLQPTKGGLEPQGRAHGRGGKNPGAGDAAATLFHQAETGSEQEGRAFVDTPSTCFRGGVEHPFTHPLRAHTVALLDSDRSPSVAGSVGDVAGLPGSVTSEVTTPYAREVSAVVSGSHAREVSTEVSSPHAREVCGAVCTVHAHAREGLALGVDIGNSGGLALVTRDGTLVDVAPMPVLADGPRSRPTVNAPLLAALVRRWDPTSAFVELVGPRPGEAAGGAFSFGRARGLIEGVLAAQGVPARHLTPATWKRAVGIPPGRDGVKDLARAEACRRWPAMAERFAAKGSDGLAEAGLIAVAGMAREAQGR